MTTETKRLRTHREVMEVLLSGKPVFEVYPNKTRGNEWTLDENGMLDTSLAFFVLFPIDLFESEEIHCEI